MQKAFTDGFVKSVRLPKRPRQDVYLEHMQRGCGLMLVVSYGGTKTWRHLTYTAGKPKTRKLGTYPQMSLKQARESALAYFENPNRAEVGSFREVSQTWLHRHVFASGMRTGSERKRMLEYYVYPKWADRPFLEIRRSDVSVLMDSIADKHGRAQADNVLGMLRAFMNWAQARSEDYVNPIVRGMQRNKPKARARIFNDDELRALWKATEGEGTFNGLIRVLLLTAQRREKVSTMHWDDLKDGHWNVRVEDREKGTIGRVALPALVLSIIEAQPRILNNPFVFAGRYRSAFNSFSQCKRMLDEKLPDMPPWRLHDLRRTARSLMSRAGVISDHAELVLGHRIPGVAGIYDRYEYLPHKGEALQRLSDLVSEIVKPATDIRKSKTGVGRA